MEYWCESPLNKAHYYERRATALLRKYLFDEAIECHTLAAQYLDEALQLTGNAQAVESIQLQLSFHLKQQDFLKVKKVQYLALLEAVRVQKEAMSRMLKARSAGGKDSNTGVGEGVTLQRAIYRTIEEADSLLELLVHRGDGAVDNSPTTSASDTTPLGSKLPKDDHTVIEELRIVNYQLRSLITELMTQLMTSESQVAALKMRVSELEAESAPKRPPQAKDSGSASVSAYSSPFVFSPADGLSPDGGVELGEIAELVGRTPELPVLAPLPLPDFDLTVLHKKHH